MLGHHVVYNACRSEWSSQQLPHLQVCQLLVQVPSQRRVCSACRHLCKTISFRIGTVIFELPALGLMRMAGCPMHLHPDPSEAHQGCCSCDLTPSCASSRSRPLRRDKISRRACACRLARSPMGRTQLQRWLPFAAADLSPTFLQSSTSQSVESSSAYGAAWSKHRTAGWFNSAGRVAIAA